jgi:nucleoside-diphosphate-sugar epimerase
MIPKIALVTGGNGFLGSHLVDRLLSLGCQVRVIDAAHAGPKDGVELIRSSVSTANALAYAMRQADVVYHFANLRCNDPITSFETNVRGTLIVLDTARRLSVSRVICATEIISCREGANPRSDSPYVMSRLVIERYVKSYFNWFGLKSTCLRFGDVYGTYPPDEGFMTSPLVWMIGQIIKQEKHIAVPQRFNWDSLPVSNAIDAIILATTAKLDGEPINIASGESHTPREILSIVNSIRGLLMPKIVRGQFDMPWYSGKVNINRAKDLLGFKPRGNLVSNVRKYLATIRGADKENASQY